MNDIEIIYFKPLNRAGRERYNTDENGNVDGVLYNIFRKLLVETGRDKQPNDQLSLF